MFKHVIQDAVTLFVIIDPIALVPLFIAITRREDAIARRQIALRAVLLSAVVLLSFIAIGQFLLDALGISLEAFQIGGGLVLTLIGLQMVFEETETVEDVEGEVKNIATQSDVAVFPLATPFIAGPGAILSVVLLTDNAKFSIADQVATGLVTLLILAFTYLTMVQSERIQRLLGDTGTNMVTRIVGLIVVAIAIQTILTGISSFFKI